MPNIEQRRNRNPQQQVAQHVHIHVYPTRVYHRERKHAPLIKNVRLKNQFPPQPKPATTTSTAVTLLFPLRPCAKASLFGPCASSSRLTPKIAPTTVSVSISGCAFPFSQLDTACRVTNSPRQFLLREPLRHAQRPHIPAHFVHGNHLPSLSILLEKHPFEKAISPANSKKPPQRFVAAVNFSVYVVP